MQLKDFNSVLEQLSNYGQVGCEEIQFKVIAGGVLAPIVTGKPNWFFRFVRWLFQGGYQETKEIKKVVSFLEANQNLIKININPLKEIFLKKITVPKEYNDLENRFNLLIAKTNKIANVIISNPPNQNLKTEKNEKENLTKENKAAQLLHDDYTGKKLLMMTLDEKLKLAKEAGKNLTFLSFKDTPTYSWQFNCKDPQTQESLKYVCAIKDEQLLEVFQACPNIQALNLNLCSALTDAICRHLSNNLKELDLSQCVKLTDATFTHLPADLKKLSLSKCEISNDAIPFLPQNLQELDLSCCDHLSHIGIKNLPKKLINLNLQRSSYWNAPTIIEEGLKDLPITLETLNLSGWNNLSYHGIDLYLKKLRNLKKLDLSYCTKMTDHCLKILPNKLQSLKLKGCNLLTYEAVNKLKNILED